MRVTEVVAAHAGPYVAVPVVSVWEMAAEEELVTQALLWEPVTVVAERAGWLEVRLPLQPHPGDPRGYPGWIRAGQLADEQPPAVADWEVLTRRLNLIDGDLVLSAGTWLPRVGDALVLPDGRTIAPPGGDDPRDLVDVAAQWLDVPYLWGGLSGHGVDCSGLVHLSSRVRDRVVPRDARDQAVALDPVEGRERGDLLFFWTTGRDRIRHVVISLDDDHFLHAPQTGRGVEVVAGTPDWFTEDFAWATADPTRL